MSSRRKSSTPCMVRAISNPPEEQDDPEEVMDVEMLMDKDITKRDVSESSESAENSLEPRQEISDQPAFPKPWETQNPEPLEQEEQSDKEDKPSVLEDVEGRELDNNDVVSNSDLPSQKKQVRGYECKYCPFLTQNLTDFKEHVDSSHPNVILNPLYLCAVCNFNTKKFDSLTEHNESLHPGETNFKFKRIKMNNQTILEQTIEGKDNSADCVSANQRGESSSDSPFVNCISTTLKTPDSIHLPYQDSKLKSHLDGLIHKDQITAVNINGTVIIPEPTMLQGLSHVTPMLQRPPNFNSIPKIAVPLNTTKYNPSLDDNLTLITSFNKFPYPTHAELSWLTAASKHPEEQIKVWFTTQRLKQGITWSPEEVEEARKKMFNGSIPPSHHTFTTLPASPISQPSAKVLQQPIVHTTVEHLTQVQTSLSNGSRVVNTSNSPVTISSSHTLKRPLPTHLTKVFGPESKRPIMAVAPHSGDPKDKGLMAPPPPPPPQKDRLPMAPPPVPMEMKRPVAVPLVSTEVKRPSATVPLMPLTSTSSQSLLSKGKLHSSVGNPKTKPVVSMPSIVFPESLTRPMIAPPPIFAPSFKNTMLIPRSSPISSKEKHLNAHSLPATDLKLPNSPPVITPQIRRPTIIQSLRAPAKAPPQIPGFTLDSKQLKEQQGGELKASYPREDKVLSPLSEANGTSRTEAKWSHCQTSPSQNNGIMHLDSGDTPAVLKSDFQQKSSVLTQFPLLERMKGKSADQLKILEENFLRNSFPTHSDIDNLAATTRLSHQEIDSWFVERRALRDNLEQALLNSMGSKRMGTNSIPAVTDNRQQQHQTLQLNGIHKPSTGLGHLKSPPPSSLMLPIIAPGTVVPSVLNPTSCSVPPDSRSLTLLKDDFAQTRWPSPEEFSQLEGQTGMARWFTDNRSVLHSGSMELTELLQKSTVCGVNGGQGSQVCSPEKASNSIKRGQDSAATNNGSNKVLEVELGWLMEQRACSLSSKQHEELQDRFTSRFRQQNAAELKNGGQNGGVGVLGGARDVFGSWLEDGHSRQRRELLLDREKKMAENTSGRLTG
ncbi:zinc fingers and homeoboxes protein 2-like [Thalassophryne amazonica]|uniref:zinc fingers and homeoboxes protein 2-like n=1 Tax=Thalassophryne amazonica TaxID=390379 RepID=UPI00147173E8|nr:zinc fingers and homeoboxes protein 2-like [Thalassophryne amazonica]XP_034016781.1 zinc fingers and homeoboxes protein 2-like [Thalassophryne amazonica]XP_034016782.1 zinc fingers and homeoboxes protein 2-like [Thalassophryne amazonica]XP_034016783.1 zinc fingers and homeoboxes protein 2-like [Thalassophryne amazonica]